jgi:hypothetical protein
MGVQPAQAVVIEEEDVKMDDCTSLGGFHRYQDAVFILQGGFSGIVRTRDNGREDNEYKQGCGQNIVAAKKGIADALHF